MKSLLSAAGRSFLRAFAAALIVFAPGILSAPDLHSALLVGVSGLLAAIAAGVRTIQAYVPKLSFSSYLGPDVGRYLDSALQAFVGALCVTLPTLLRYPEDGDWKALWTSLIVAVLAAATRGVQALGTQTETLTKANAPQAAGLTEPPNP